MLRDRRVIIPLQNRFPPANPCRDLTMLKNALFYHYVRFVLKANIISRHTDRERERERERGEREREREGREREREKERE